MDILTAKTDPALREIVKTLMMMMEMAGLPSMGYYKKMAGLCTNYSNKLGLGAEAAEAIRFAALLHDVGMIFLPKALRDKSEPTQADSVQIRQHPAAGEKVLANLSVLSPILPIVRHHHERPDGKGYPDGLQGDAIPAGARILCIVENFTALTTHSGDSGGMPIRVALEQMKQLSEKQYDGKLLSIFIAMMTPKRPTPVSAPEPADSGLSTEDIAKSILNQIKTGEIELPSLPDNVHAVQQALSNPDTTMDSLAELIGRDANLSVSLMATANSPAYAGQMKVRSLREAITRIGLKETQSVITTLITKSMFHTNLPDFLEILKTIWQHSLACAYGARLIAEHLEFPSPEKYFLMGMLHDIGKVLILQSLIKNRQWRQALNDPARLKIIMKSTHNSIGAVMLRHWKFPKEFFEMVTSHEGPTFYKTTAKATLIVALASRLANFIGYGDPPSASHPAEFDAAQRLGMDATSIDKIGDTVKYKVTESMQHVSKPE